MVTLEKLRFTVCCLFAVLPLAGCSAPLAPREPGEAPRERRAGHVVEATIAAVQPSDRLFFPLEIGNRWSYRRHYRIQEFLDGQPPSPPIFETGSQVDIELTERTQISGREYVVWRERRPEGNGVFVYRLPSRQDRSGFYRLGGEIEFVAGSVRDAGVMAPEVNRRAEGNLQHALEVLALTRDVAAAGLQTAGPDPDPRENRLLLYPLRPGLKWGREPSTRPFTTYEVEAQEVLDLPAGRFAAWRIRVELPGLPNLLGPNDRVYWWWGREGLVKSLVHAETVIRDESVFPPAIVGIRKVDVAEDLIEIDLVRPEDGRSSNDEPLTRFGK